MKRREFFKTSIVASAAVLGSSTSLLASDIDIHQPSTDGKVSKKAFPQKQPLITHSDRPPLLESPMRTFTRGITENDEFFVRWHLPDIPTHIDLDKYRLKVNGLVDQTLELSVDDLKNNFDGYHLLNDLRKTSVFECR